MYRRSYYRGRSAKWSNETIAFNVDLTDSIDGGVSFPESNQAMGGDSGVLIVNSTSVLGNRKCKNFTIKVTAKGNDDQIFGVLAYVPEGITASSIQCTGLQQSLYEPNQNVIATFIIPPSCDRDNNGMVTGQYAPTTVTVSNRLARNLNSGDCVVMVLCSPNGLTAGDGTGGNPEPITISGTVNYAIKY